MLALYDRNAEAPAELKVIDTLYQPRGKQPIALNNTFEDDVVSSFIFLKNQTKVTWLKEVLLYRGCIETEILKQPDLE